MHNTSDISLNYYGYFTPFGGYGIANINSAKYLRRSGVNVVPHAKFIPDKTSLEWKSIDDEERELFQIPWEKHKIGMIGATPFDFNIVDNQVKIAWTMCESDFIGDPWVKASNGMDYVFLPNEFNRKVFEASGVAKEKLRVVKYGIDTERFEFYERPVRDVYTFGIVAYMNDRKGVFELIRAFCSEFKPYEDVRLYIKSSNKDFGYYSFFNDKRIVVDIRHLSNSEVVKLYHSFDCFVFPSKAEGVGMPPREAMSTGLPTILTNYSGLEDACNKYVNFPLEPTKLVSGLNPMTIEQPGRWAEIDIAELMYYMRWCFEHPEDAQEMGRQAAKWIREEQSWESATKDMIKALKEVS